MAMTRMNAEKRSDFGKGFARRARAAGRVPAVIYSSIMEQPEHVTVDAHEMFMVVKGAANAVLRLHVEGNDHLVLVKDVQRHPVTRQIQHVDLLAINPKEKVDVDVALVTVGEPAPDTVVSIETMALTVSAPVLNIPESIEISVEGAEDGTVIRLADVELPADLETAVDPEEVLVTVSIPQVELPEPEEGEEGEAGEDAAEDAADAAEEKSEDE